MTMIETVRLNKGKSAEEPYWSPQRFWDRLSDLP